MIKKRYNGVRETISLLADSPEHLQSRQSILDDSIDEENLVFEGIEVYRKIRMNRVIINRYLALTCGIYYSFWVTKVAYEGWKQSQLPIDVSISPFEIIYQCSLFYYPLLVRQIIAFNEEISYVVYMMLVYLYCVITIA